MLVRHGKKLGRKDQRIDLDRDIFDVSAMDSDDGRRYAGKTKKSAKRGTGRPKIEEGIAGPSSGFGKKPGWATPRSSKDCAEWASTDLGKR